MTNLRHYAKKEEVIILIDEIIENFESLDKYCADHCGKEKDDFQIIEDFYKENNFTANWLNTVLGDLIDNTFNQKGIKSEAADYWVEFIVKSIEEKTTNEWIKRAVSNEYSNVTYCMRVCG